MPPIVGIAAFLVVVAALFALQFFLGRRYERGRGRDRAFDDLKREIQLRDGMLGYPGGPIAPYPAPSEASPRDRLHEPDERE